MPSTQQRTIMLELNMARDEESDVKHLHFLQWELSSSIQINGVAPFKFPGRGI